MMQALFIRVPDGIRYLFIQFSGRSFIFDTSSFLRRPACTNFELILNGFKAARQHSGLMTCACGRFSFCDNQ